MKKSNLNKFYATNRDEAENGKWFTIAPGVELKVRKATSNNAAAVRRRLGSGFPNGVPPEMEQEQARVNIAHGIVVDWRGIEIDGAAVGQYDADLFLDMLADLPDLAELVANLSITDANFRINEDDQVKN